MHEHELKQYLTKHVPEAEIEVEEVMLLTGTQVYGTVKYCGHTWEKKAEEWIATDMELWTCLMHAEVKSASATSTIPIGDSMVKVKGFPRGSLTLLHGGRKTGKTDLCLRTIAPLTQNGGSVLYVDFDQKLDKEYALSLGIDPERFRIVSPPSRVHAARELVRAIKKGTDMVVFDSLGDLFPEDPVSGPQTWSAYVPMIREHLENSNTAFVAVAKEHRHRSGAKGGMIWRFFSTLILQTHEDKVEVIKNRFDL